MFDAKKLLAFPGCVDAHMHVGIYRPLAEDAVSESKAAAMGGVTSSLNYIRTGHYYLNRGGPYREFMPEVLKLSEGRFWVDYGYHVAPIESGSPRRDGLPRARTRRHLVQDLHVLRRLRAARQIRRAEPVPHDRPEERYDIAHFEFVMRVGAVGHGPAPGARRPHQRQPALRACRDPQRLHQDGRARGQVDRAACLQRRAAAAFGGACGMDRLLPRQRNRLPEHQPAAPELAQGDRRGVDDAAGLSRTSISGAKSPSGTCCSTPTARAPCTRRSIRRSARARTWRRCGRPCSTARSTGSSATTPAARRSRNGRRTTPTISGSPSPASAAPNICSPACSARAASAACRTTAWPSF